MSPLPAPTPGPAHLAAPEQSAVSRHSRHQGWAAGAARGSLGHFTPTCVPGCQTELPGSLLPHLWTLIWVQAGVCVNIPVVTAVAVGEMSRQLGKEPAATVTVRRQPHTHGTRSAVPRCGRAGLAGCPQLGTEKVLVLGHGSRAWLGAGTPGMETLPHLESFAAKRAGLQQALPTICRCTGENNAGVCQTNSLELPPVPGACVLKRKPELRLQRNLGK